MLLILNRCQALNYDAKRNDLEKSPNLNPGSLFQYNILFCLTPQGVFS